MDKSNVNISSTIPLYISRTEQICTAFAEHLGIFARALSSTFSLAPTGTFLQASRCTFLRRGTALLALLRTQPLALGSSQNQDRTNNNRKGLDACIHTALTVTNDTMMLREEGGKRSVIEMLPNLRQRKIFFYNRLL